MFNLWRCYFMYIYDLHEIQRIYSYEYEIRQRVDLRRTSPVTRPIADFLDQRTFRRPLSNCLSVICISLKRAIRYHHEIHFNKAPVKKPPCDTGNLIKIYHCPLIQFGLIKIQAAAVLYWISFHVLICGTSEYRKCILSVGQLLVQIIFRCYTIILPY